MLKAGVFKRRRSMPKTTSSEQKIKLLEILLSEGNISKASEEARIARGTAYSILEEVKKLTKEAWEVKEEKGVEACLGLKEANEQIDNFKKELEGEKKEVKRIQKEYLKMKVQRDFQGMRLKWIEEDLGCKKKE